MKKFLCFLALVPVISLSGFVHTDEVVIDPVTPIRNYDHGKEKNSIEIVLTQEIKKEEQTKEGEEEEEKKDFIKWIDFNVSATMIASAAKAHRELVAIGIKDIGTCRLLAYLAVKNGNKFSKKDGTTLSKLVTELKAGNTESLDKYADNKYYNYYVQSYHAVLDGIIDSNTGEVKGYHPIAKGFGHTGSDDFGVGRTYGFRRKHLGHDMFGLVGTPVIAMEGGTITELGWNRYGGWRIGIRSDDTKRYYYYAHLRKNWPYPKHFELGGKVEAGDVIGYLGRTGYSGKENKNMDTKPHLHFGMQIIFDKSQEDGNGEIWIDVYQICKFLQNQRSKAIKDPETKEWRREV